ncbi:hypothetical protein P5673_005388 [Acropora cervicornis]|uniref:Uncharacterized protein n=1 Tax=Acropora cervicornis TaxID=6130 RepID=A0AAD9QXY8_ACRCE|nr:hypothetical protein P5673_005388 [Acropora cervicornis]
MSQSQFSWLSKLTSIVLVLNLLVIEGDSVYQVPYCKVNPFNCIALKQKLSKDRVKIIQEIEFMAKRDPSDRKRTDDRTNQAEKSEG